MTGRMNCFSMIDENGEEIVYDVLFTLESEETGKKYIVYTDNTKDEDGSIQVYASVCVQEDGREKLEAIETDAEWKAIDIIMDTLQEKLRQEEAEKDMKETVGDAIDDRFRAEFMDCGEEDIPFCPGMPAL